MYDSIPAPFSDNIAYKNNFLYRGELGGMVATLRRFPRPSLGTCASASRATIILWPGQRGYDPTKLGFHLYRSQFHASHDAHVHS